MSADHQTLIAEALAGHQAMWTDRGFVCSGCEHVYVAGNPASYADFADPEDIKARIRGHQAAALLDSPEFAAVLADVRAGAWDEGHDAAYLFERGEVHPEPRNPYRSDERTSHE